MTALERAIRSQPAELERLAARDLAGVAARLEGLAEPSGICISETAYAQVRNKLALAYEDLGAQRVKNIAEPVRVWRVVLDRAALGRRERGRIPRRWRTGVLSLPGLAIGPGTIVLVQHLSPKAPRTSCPAAFTANPTAE